MIHIIYMAAGNSRRFGSNKLFYELDGKPMYRHLLDRLAEIKNRYNKSKSDSQTIDITVVTRYREILDYCACIQICMIKEGSNVPRKGHTQKKHISRSPVQQQGCYKADQQHHVRRQEGRCSEDRLRRF